MIDEQDALNGQGAARDQFQVDNNHETMESLMRSENAGLEFPSQGEIRKGVIASISPTQILVSVGSKSEGVIMGRELDQIPASERQELAVGQEIPVYVLNPEDQKRKYRSLLCSRPRAMGWEHVEAMQESGESFEGKIEGYQQRRPHRSRAWPAQALSRLRRLA